MMGQHKPWYLSRTIWASLVVVLLAGAEVAGYPIGQGDGDLLVVGIMQLVTAGAGILAIVGRVAAKSRIL